MRQSIVFNSTELLPAEWNEIKIGPLWVFNPGLLKHENEWIFAYRMVGVDDRRRIALCRLNKNFEVIANSQVPFSDLIEQTLTQKQKNAFSFRRWFADPRLYHLNGKHFIYWNSGWHEPQNFQYLQEFNPKTLRPIGSPREMVLLGERQPLEKNWTLFEKDRCLYSVYSVNPHRILTLSLEGNDGDIIFQDFISHHWNMEQYSECYGTLRGGSPPILVNNIYYSFCHSLYWVNEALHYAVSVYCFNAEVPFEPVMAPIKILELENPLGTHTMLPRLNAAVTKVNYPCGAHFEEDNFIISYGINDELCMIAIIPYHEVTSILKKTHE